MSIFINNAPFIGLLLFFAIFIWVAYRAYRPNMKKKLQEHALIPLEEERHEQ